MKKEEMSDMMMKCKENFEKMDEEMQKKCKSLMLKVQMMKAKEMCMSEEKDERMQKMCEMDEEDEQKYMKKEGMSDMMMKKEYNEQEAEKSKLDYYVAKCKKGEDEDAKMCEMAEFKMKCMDEEVM